MTEQPPGPASSGSGTGTGTDIDAAELDVEADVELPASSDPEQFVDADDDLGGAGGANAGGTG